MESFVQGSSKGERKGADLKAEKRRLCKLAGGVEPAGLLLMGGPLLLCHHQWAPRPSLVDKTPPGNNTIVTGLLRGPLCTHTYESVLIIGIGIGVFLPLPLRLPLSIYCETSLTMHHGTDQEAAIKCTHENVGY